MEKQHNESNYPSGTWESVWVNLIIKATEEWRTWEMHRSLSTTRQLYAWLPQECKKDCKELMDKLLKDYSEVCVRTADYINRRLILHKKQQSFLYNSL